jgi:uncharacterized protein YndB with AHSA1/START domain
MGRIRVSTVIDAPPAQVWDEVRHVERHVDWMADAVEIRFTSRRRSGVGTTFDCLTRVGPIRLTDKMEITDWRDGKLMGVRHVGLVTGTGRFTVTKVRGGRTRFTWDERLKFPWWLGGPVGGVVGGRIMRQIWKRNLRVLKALVESGRS